MLLPWWENHSYARHMYYGLGVYRMAEAKSGVWLSPNELLWQIRDIRTKAENPGVVFYSASSFDKIGPAVRDSLKQVYNRHPAFPPQMPWIDSTAPAAPQLKVIPSAEGTLLEWEHHHGSKERIVYAVYRFSGNERVNLEHSEHIISVQQEDRFMDKDANKYKNPVYVVTALDRLWNESRGSNVAGYKEE